MFRPYQTKVIKVKLGGPHTPSGTTRGSHTKDYYELGGTGGTYTVINTAGTRPMRTDPRRLPYALRMELEDELDRLESSGCSEPPNSPCALGLVLVR